MTPRDSLAGLAHSPTLRLLIAAVVGAFTAGGTVALWSSSRVSKAEAAEMLAPVAAETHANTARLLTLGNDVHVLLGRDRVRYDARQQEKRLDRRDDAEAQAVAVYDAEVLSGTPIEQAKITALRARIP